MVKQAKTRPSPRSKKGNAKKATSAKADNSVAKLKSNPKTAPKRWATAKGEFVVPEDFNDPLPKEIEELFYQVEHPLGD